MHGESISIMSTRGIQYTSNFWEIFQEDLGTKLDLSGAFHPQTGGQYTWMIHALKDMLQTYVMVFGSHWN